LADHRPPQEDPFDAIFGRDEGADQQEGHAPPGESLPAQPASRRAARERARIAAADAAPEPNTRSQRRRADEGAYPEHEKRGRRGLIASIVVVVTLAAIAGGGLYVWNTFEPQIREVLGWQEPNDYTGSGSGEVMVVIEEGDTGTDIAQTLTDEGVTKTVDAFYELLLDEPTEPVFHPGVYRLAERMSARAALDALLDPANKVERTALIREGITGKQILEELSNATQIPVADFQAAIADPTQYGVPAGVPSIEGWLFPAQYTFDPGVTATQVIQTLVDRTIQALDEGGVPVQDRERILTIASIIQREARLPDDFYKVSRVIQNRLAQNMMLQMDSTAQYGVEAATDSVWSSHEALTDDNPWNTYAHTGLPIGPISSPGDAAIDAAMHPADGPWIFFVTVNLQTGETVFSETVEEHDAAVEQLRAWCAQNPGQGC